MWTLDLSHLCLRFRSDLHPPLSHILGKCLQEFYHFLGVCIFMVTQELSASSILLFCGQSKCRKQCPVISTPRHIPNNEGTGCLPLTQVWGWGGGNSHHPITDTSKNSLKACGHPAWRIPHRSLFNRLRLIIKCHLMTSPLRILLFPHAQHFRDLFFLSPCGLCPRGLIFPSKVV